MVCTKHFCTSSIDNSGRTNVSADLADWLNTTGSDGDTLILRRTDNGCGPGKYFVPQGVFMERTNGVTLDLNGCWLFTGGNTGSEFSPLFPDQITSWPRARYTLTVYGNNMIVKSSMPGARLQGGGRTASMNGFVPYGIAFVSSLEAQAGLRVLGDGQVIDITNIEIAFTYGDGIQLIATNFFGSALTSTNVTIKGVRTGPTILRGGYQNAGLGGILGAFSVDANGTGSAEVTPVDEIYHGIHHIGRQGISAVKSDGVVIRDISIWQSSRAIYDLEPASVGATVDNVQILRTESNSNLLNTIAAGGRQVNNLVVEDNICYGPFKINNTSDDESLRHSNWTLRRNTSTAVWKSGSASIFNLSRTDGLTVEDNFQAAAFGFTNADDIMVGSSTSVTISPAALIQFPQAGFLMSSITATPSPKTPTVTQP